MRQAWRFECFVRALFDYGNQFGVAIELRDAAVRDSTPGRGA